MTGHFGLIGKQSVVNIDIKDIVKVRYQEEGLHQLYIAMVEDPEQYTAIIVNGTDEISVGITLKRVFAEAGKTSAKVVMLAPLYEILNNFRENSLSEDDLKLTISD